MSDTKEYHREFKTNEDFDKEFFKNIERKTNIWQCIQCGTCTVLGDLSVLSDPDIWLCTTCYQCYERCPRDVRPTDVIMELRNYATKRGNISPNHRAVVGYLQNYGHAVPINDEIKQRRVELGLDELPPTAFKFKQEGDAKDLKKFEEHLFDLPPVTPVKEEKKKVEEK